MYDQADDTRNLQQQQLHGSNKSICFDQARIPLGSLASKVRIVIQMNLSNNKIINGNNSLPLGKSK
jgi:hypothetical protein